MTIESKSDRDKIRNRAGRNKRILLAAIRAVKECDEGRAVSACFADLRREVKAAQGK